MVPGFSAFPGCPGFPAGRVWLKGTVMRVDRVKATFSPTAGVTPVPARGTVMPVDRVKATFSLYCGGAG
ncbi:hypothetical protein G419_21312 [Rhodococcus triatomae BKS 15-14]|nr:hypothetical protein G419_21312 [Rhodococcus triatomae BKS 15-14]